MNVRVSSLDALPHFSTPTICSLVDTAPVAGAEYLYLVWLPFIPQATVCHGFHLSALAMAVQLTEFKVVYRCIIRLFAKIIYKHFLQVVGIEPTVPSNQLRQHLHK